MRHRPSSPVLALLALTFASTLAHAAPSAAPAPDQGSFVVLSYGRPVGREDFTFSVRGDSLVLESQAELTIDPSQPTRRKQMRMVYRKDDWRLLAYNSSMAFEGRVYRVGVAPGPDSTVTVYHEVDENGEANTYYRPPGRLYVLDALFYSLFQVMVTSLAGQDFDARPITILAVGARDTVDAAVVRHAGTDSIRWGERPVVARKLRFEQGRLTFEMWLDARDRVLRITHAASGLEVERKPPAVRRRPRPKPAG